MIWFKLQNFMKETINKILDTVVYQDEEDTYTVRDFSVTIIIFIAIVIGLGVCGTVERLGL